MYVLEIFLKDIFRLNLLLHFLTKIHPQGLNENEKWLNLVVSNLYC